MSGQAKFMKSGSSGSFLRWADHLAAGRSSGSLALYLLGYGRQHFDRGFCQSGMAFHINDQVPVRAFGNGNANR
jgi:hypothetical protein